MIGGPASWDKTRRLSIEGEAIIAIVLAAKVEGVAGVEDPRTGYGEATGCCGGCCVDV